MKMKETCWNEYRDPRMLVFKALACKNRIDIINTLKPARKMFSRLLRMSSSIYQLFQDT